MTEQASANALRGESTFTVGSETHLLRPSFENLVAAEEEVGSLFALVDRAASNGLTLAEMQSLIWHCISSEHKPSRDAVGGAILSVGMVEATKPIRVILGQVLQGQP